MNRVRAAVGGEPSFRVLKGVLLIFGVLFVLAAVGAPASRLSAAEERPTAGRAGAGTRASRFGKLTSRRWAYGEGYRRENLHPVPNPNPAPERKPRRDRPFDVALSKDGRKVYITLQGSELEPGSEVAVYDVERESVLKRIPLRPAGESGPPASSPFRLALHPAGRHLLVSSRFSDFLSVIDTEKDEVVSEVPLDFYAQGMVFDGSGRRAFVADRYLDQVFVVDVDARAGGSFRASMRELGGLDDKAFFGTKKGPGAAAERPSRSSAARSASGLDPGIHALLVRRCGKCHSKGEGRFYAGPDKVRSFLSALEHVKPGEPGQSRLLRAVTRTRDGGCADSLPKVFRHKGGVVFADVKGEADYQALARWVSSSSEGPGIPVGNERSKPKMLALDPAGRWLFVGNTGTQDISIVNARTLREVGSIYVQNVVNDLAVYRSPATGRRFLLVSTNGIGFDVLRERDPWGGESWDRKNPAAQYTVWRDLKTGRPLPRSRQEVLGPFDAVDGTAGIKFRDIQNDILVVDVDALDIPEEPPKGGLSRLLLANRYEAHPGWVRYTSDTAESTAGDPKGDIPPDLMRVVGALPEKIALSGDRVFVSMQGSNQVQELRIQPEASEPSDRLVPAASYRTGWQPIGIAAGIEGTPSAGKLFTANFMGGTLSIIDRKTGESREVVVDPSILERPMPDSNAERGEMLVHSAVFSSDGDSSCIHCHYLDMGDGRPQGVSQVVGQEFLSEKDEEGQLVDGGTMGVPQMRGLFGIQPFFMEGAISAFEPRSMIMEHAPADDFARPIPGGDYTGLEAHYRLPGESDVQSRMSARAERPESIEERRDAMFRERTMRYFGKAFTLRDFQRFVGEWQIHEPRLLPNPFDKDSASVRRGRELFNHPQAGCVSCHPPPHFAKKDFPANREQALPPMTTFTMRDGSFTLISMNRLDYITGTRRDLEPWDIGRAEEVQGRFTPFSLRGIWDRPPVFLHNGMARTLHEALATPGHRGLRWFKYEPLLGGFPERVARREAGFNATYVVSDPSPKLKAFMKSGSRLGVDTHGGTLQLSGPELDDLVNYLNTIE